MIESDLQNPEPGNQQPATDGQPSGNGVTTGTELIQQPTGGPEPTDGPEPANVVVPSYLPATHHEAYKMKLAGRPVEDIAAYFGVDRVTVWRWTKGVEREYRDTLENEQTINLIAAEVARLTDLEQQARKHALETKSDRARALYLGEARRAAVSRQSLLVTVGILPKSPDMAYRAIVQLKPKCDYSEDGPKATRPREEIIEELIDKLQQVTRL